MPGPARKRNPHFTTDRLDAGEALNRAHFLAMAPYAFEAARILRDRGILEKLEAVAGNGCVADELATTAHLPLNSAIALLEAGLGIGIISCDLGRYYLTMAGQYFLRDATVRANTDFMRDICLPPIGELEHSLDDAQPHGLSEFTDRWNNVFEALPTLPQPVRNSWFGFNNHHSDASIAAAMPLVLAQHPERILDLGGGTGRFALAALREDEHIHIGIADLLIDNDDLPPDVLSAPRVSLHPLNVLCGQQLPAGYDTIWMSQFLPCFSEQEVVDILKRCAEALPATGTIWVLETFWNRQRYEAAAAALQMTSLYFVNIATGKSRMWRSDDIERMAAAAGLEVLSVHDGMGRGHTLMQLRRM